jgi:hypothetical protein
MTRRRALAALALAAAIAGTAGRADPAEWPDYQIIMWQDHTAIENAALKALGVSAAMVIADRSLRQPEFVAAQIAPLRTVGLPWFVENIATDFYSSYHRWSGNRPVNWGFLEAKARHRARPDDPAPFRREPSLSDPAQLATIRDRLETTVAAHRADRPLYYDLADEPGIADLAAAWDFDLAPPSLAGMRAWLREQYGTLAALNAEWGTRFADWGTVMPMTTDQALRRTDDNLAAWADFKAWMDVAFARALRAGTDAVHRADPAAIAAIEGAQIPGWGGYDYTRLVDAVDMMEPYDYGDNVAIIHALKPAMIMITTSYRSGAAEMHRIWRELLRGTRGLLLWDDKGEFVAPDGGRGPRGRELAPLFAELRGGLGALLINSRRMRDPIALLYSPASERTQWLLDRRAEATDWAARSASVEFEDTPIRAARRAALAALDHAGLAPRILSPDALAAGALARDGDRLLVLPGAIALSDAELDAIRAFAAAGGAVVADRAPGAFDQHSRRRAATPAIAWRDGPLIDLARRAGIAPRVAVTRADGSPTTDVELYRFRNGDVEILALLRDQADSPAPETVTVRLPNPVEMVDLRAGVGLGRRDRLTVVLDGVDPAILALSDHPPPDPSVTLPPRVRAGAAATLAIDATRPDDARVVFHVTAVDPFGNVGPAHSANLLGPGGHVTTALAFARDDPTGRWTIEVTDRLSGHAARVAIEVTPPPVAPVTAPR